jgi:hypothetical protein
MITVGGRARTITYASLATAVGPGARVLSISPSRSSAAALRESGGLRLKVTTVYTPDGNRPTQTVTKAVLVRAR